MEGKHSVHLLLIFGKAVENAASWRSVEETHGTVDDLWRKTKELSSSRVILQTLN